MILIIQRDESEQDGCDIRTDAVYSIPLDEFDTEKEWKLFIYNSLKDILPFEWKYEDVVISRTLKREEHKKFQNWHKENNIFSFIENKFNVKPLKFDLYIQ